MVRCGAATLRCRCVLGWGIFFFAVIVFVSLTCFCYLSALPQLCNAPSLPLSELAPSEDHVELLLPAAPGSHALAAKALFRRGKCYSELSEDGRALSDYQAAHRLSPQNKQILDALLGAEDTAGRVPSEWGAKGESRSDYCPSAASAAVSAWGGQGGGGSTGAPATATTAAGSTQSGSADEADGALAVDGGDPAEGEMDSCASVSSACTATTFPAAAAAAAAAATVTATATGGMKQQQQPSVAPPPGPGVGNRERMRPADAAPFPVDLTANGGHCWLRRGHWSQTVADAAVYLPVALFIGRHAAEMVTGRQQWKVEFKRMAVIVTFQPLPSSSGGSGSDGGAGKAATLPLEHIIVSSECTWTLDHVGGPLGSTAGRQHLVLHLSKAPSVEWFPGCEWWDRVFAGDEAIDTMTCSVGADTAQLPAEARAAAERESRRFADLSESQRREELDRLTRAKQCFVEAEQRTRMAAEEEDAAVGNVPEQAEMLEKLRETFPSIDFRAK